AVSRASCMRPHRELGRAGASRSRGAVVARLPAVLAADLDRARAGVAARGRGARSHSLCPAHRGRPAAFDPARGGDRLARARARPDRARARPIAGGDVAAARIARAQAARDRDVAICVIERPCTRPGTSLGTTPGTTLGGPSAGSRVRCGFITATANAARPWAVSTAGLWR